MKRILAALVMLGALSPSTSGAANIFEKVGTFDGQFLKIPVGARAEGMGGAFVGVADDPSAVFWNAAGIARIDADKSELQFNHANWIADLRFDQVAYVFHVKRLPGTWAVHARSLSMNPMNEPISTNAASTPAATGTKRKRASFRKRVCALKQRFVTTSR